MQMEVLAVEGTGKIELTGSLGDVMKESAHAAMSYIRANAEKKDLCSAMSKSMKLIKEKRSVYGAFFYYSGLKLSLRVTVLL